jgi:DNA topoisomerase-2
MKVQKFFNDDFKNFSIYDCRRSIPSVIDGFKISQRKCIFGMIKRGENAGEIKIAQAGSYVALVSSYHHGETSLFSTLIGMARDYPGTNNVNYLIPSGQFGSRLSKDSAAPRYIFTEFSPSFRKIFKKEDDCIVEHLYDDSEQIEPKYYLPIIPNVLINGASGIGTGFACDIPNYKPEDIRDNIIAGLTGIQPTELIPWYRGFDGSVVKSETGFLVTGKYEIVAPNKIHITELPIDTYNDQYKKHLIKLQDAGFIKDFKNESTEESFSFLITTTKPINTLQSEEIIKKFKLETKVSQNLTLWDENERIKVFSSTQDVIDHFVNFRLLKYEERRLKQIELLQAELTWNLEKQKFIEFYIENSKLFASKSKKELEQLLTDNGFISITELLQIRIYNLTKDDIEKLESYISKLNKEILSLSKMTPKKMYIKELEELKL